MNQEITDTLHVALYSALPLAVDREKIIAEMGEAIWAESLEKMLLSLEEGKRTEVVGFLNDGNLEKVVEVLSESNVDIDAIVTEVATSIMDEVTATAA